MTLSEFIKQNFQADWILLLGYHTNKEVEVEVEVEVEAKAEVLTSGPHVHPQLHLSEMQNEKHR